MPNHLTALDFQYPTGTVINAPARYTGYGRMGAEMADALQTHGVELTEDADTRIICSNLTGIEGFWSHQRRLVWTMWETDVLPESFRGWFERIERILVPCQMNLELFSEHHPDVRLMPLGLHERWKPTPRNTDGPLVILAAGRGWTRKGIDLALAAFTAVAATRKDVELWLRVEGRFDHSDPRWHDPRVRVIARVDDEVALYARAHIFLAPSRGEGWGLMPLQAMAQGIPTVLTDAHGHAEFAAYATGPVPGVKEQSTGMLEAGSWWAPPLDDLIDTLADHVDRYDYWRQSAQDMAAAVCEEFRWRPDLLMEQIGATTRVPTRGFFEAWEEPKVWDCRAIKPVDCEIGPHRVVIPEGTSQVWGWDVYRVLTDAGLVERAA